MKAAVLKQLGTVPVYSDFDDPSPSEGETLMQVHAAAVKNIDKLLASGKHYASYKNMPVVVGMDGVGALEDGTRIYSKGITGTLAEKALVAKEGYTVLPDHLDWATAAAIPNAVMGSYLPLKIKGKIKKGDIVLINGGTGVTGKLAIQLAKLYGAAKVIVAGHIEDKSDHLKELGADALISTRQEDENFIKQLKQTDQETPIQIVVDYLWGHSTELILKSLFREGGNAPDHVTKIISVGSLAGDEIRLSSNNLRSGKTEIIGAGLGSYTAEEFRQLNQEATPEVFRWAGEGKIKLDVKKEKLEDIATVWNQNGKGKRIVVEMY